MHKASSVVDLDGFETKTHFYIGPLWHATRPQAAKQHSTSVVILVRIHSRHCRCASRTDRCCVAVMCMSRRSVFHCGQHLRAVQTFIRSTLYQGSQGQLAALQAGFTCSVDNRVTCSVDDRECPPFPAPLHHTHCLHHNVGRSVHKERWLTTSAWLCRLSLC